MYQLYYQPDGVWVGDIMPYGKDGSFYVYHQRDTRNPGPFGEPFGWALATTKDFVTYKDYGESLKRGTDEEADQFIYAGSVFEAQGCFHAFYTGYNREFLKAGKTSQTLLHATSQDGINWEKSKEALEIPPQSGYDRRNWRDPFVLWDEERQEYLLILGARKGEDKRKQTGRLVSFTSKNLEKWKFQGDFWSPGIFTMFEMPEIFKMGDWWYLVFSEYSDGNKIHYRMSKSLYGPWIAPKDDSFDGRAYYAGRTAFDGKRRVLFGWVPTRDGDDDKNSYLWGGTFVPHEVFQREDGTLGVKPLDSVMEAFSGWKDLFNPCMKTIDIKQESVLCEEAGVLTALETYLTFEEGTREISIKFYEDLETGVSYEYRFYVEENRIVFNKCPNYPWYQCFNIGLERPIALNAGEEYHIQLIVDNDIATLYVNGTALNVRLCDRPGNALSITVMNGAIKTRGTKISTEINQ
ncbi:glycosyl hydrolase family 32 [Anaerostipes sp. 992a]|uniref:family 43 glycosylhydrolase n=1 Tax=Anaerostipes sp. 992a TaxID=1261637 RepID=UPI0009527621|nr:family 43 glycosylhydrolase [Anaerostipes sp. 992a]OLR63083.1 glycosyl hydrolase family 32 [Anaerostipes sp. 992a]